MEEMGFRLGLYSEQDTESKYIVSKIQRLNHHGLLKDSDHVSVSLSYLCHRTSITIIA